MPVAKEHIFDTGIYFITFTNYRWISLFSLVNGYDLVYNWFDSLLRNGHSVLGYVIMPNHVHVLVGYITSRNSINTVVGNGKRFMSYDIVQRLSMADNAEMLKTLSEGVSESDKKKGTKHRCFEEKADIQLCRTYKFVQQKLDYMHSNPVSKKWSLVTDPVKYPHSSAIFYATEVQGIYAVRHVNAWIMEHWN